MVTEKIERQIKAKHFRKIVAKNKGGYNSYLQNKALLGNIAYIFNYENREDIEDIFKKNVLELLEEGKTYSVLLHVNYIKDGELKGGGHL